MSHRAHRVSMAGFLSGSGDGDGMPASSPGAAIVAIVDGDAGGARYRHQTHRRRAPGATHPVDLDEPQVRVRYSPRPQTGSASAVGSSRSIGNGAAGAGPPLKR